MCGIFGMGFLSPCKNPKTIAQLTAELLNSVEVRGTDAAGVAFVSDTKIHVVKDGVSGSVLSKSIKFKNACEEMINENLLQIIGHCRAETKGTYLHNVNNHPVIAEKVVGVHNGFVMNDDDLFEYYGEQNSITRGGEVDTEIIFRLIDYHNKRNDNNLIDSVSSAMAELSGSFACAFTQTEKPHILGLFRLYNPTVIRHYVKDNMILYCSTDNLIDLAINQVKEKALLDYTKCTYDAKSSLFINLHSGKFLTVSNLPT